MFDTICYANQFAKKNGLQQISDQFSTFGTHQLSTRHTGENPWKVKEACQKLGLQSDAPLDREGYLILYNSKPVKKDVVVSSVF